VGATSQPLGFPAPLARLESFPYRRSGNFGVQDAPAGQAVHTGCLSAAPQRFVIGSNSFRSLTCFEEPLRLIF